MHWSEFTIDHWLWELDRPGEPPLVRERVRTAVSFLEVHARHRDDQFVLGYLKSIDFTSEVLVTLLGCGERLAAFRRPQAAQEQRFFTRAGTSVLDLGIDPRGRRFSLYSVRSMVEALESRIAPYNDKDTGYAAGGGGMQYIIFDSGRFLERIRTGTRVACGATHFAIPDGLWTP